MPAVKMNFFRHDGEGRFLDQTGAFFREAPQQFGTAVGEALGDKIGTAVSGRIGEAVVVAEKFGEKAVTVLRPAISKFTWTAGVFGYTAIANTAISACSAIGNMAIAGYAAYKGAKVADKISKKVGQAVDTICQETPKAVKALKNFGERVGIAAGASGRAMTSIARSMGNATEDVHQMSDSFRLIAVAVAVSSTAIGTSVFRNSICSTDPTSFFCMSPFLTFVVIGGTSLGIINKWALNQPSERERQATLELYAELDAGHETIQQILAKHVSLKKETQATEQLYVELDAGHETIQQILAKPTSLKKTN